MQWPWQSNYEVKERGQKIFLFWSFTNSSELTITLVTCSWQHVQITLTGHLPDDSHWSGAHYVSLVRSTIMYHLSASQPQITCPDHMYHLSGSHYVSLVQITIMYHLSKSHYISLVQITLHITGTDHITYHLSGSHYIPLVQINLTNHLSRSISYITCPDHITYHLSRSISQITCPDQSHISLVQINLTNPLTCISIV